jgi:DNA (cytosine-5)-methyltransferase 1
LGFEDQRGVLFFDALRIIKAKKPKYALMENVKGLTTKKFQFELETMLDLLEQEGYVNYLPDGKVLNARNHNIPQNRERLFIISIRKDIDQGFKFPEKVPLTKQLSDVLEEDAQLPILHNIYGGFNEDTSRIFEEYSPTIRTSAGGGHIPSVVTQDKIILEDFYKNREVRVYDKYSPTIRSGRSGLKIAIKRGDNWIVPKDTELETIQTEDGDEFHVIRQMSTLEAWRLMGFSDEDHHKAKEALNQQLHKGKDKSKKKLYDMAGNSIVVNVVEEILKRLFIHNKVESK